MSNHNTIENWDKKWVTMKEPMERDCWVKIRVKKVASLIASWEKVLDIGCGTGYIAKFLNPLVDYTGIDFSMEGLRHVAGKTIMSDILKFKYGKDKYDTVLMMEIVEHLDKPWLIINKAGICARHQVIITVPNNRMGPDSNVFHVAKYTKESIVDLIKHSYPFKEIKVQAPGGNIICQCIK